MAELGKLKTLLDEIRRRLAQSSTAERFSFAHNEQLTFQELFELSSTNDLDKLVNSCCDVLKNPLQHPEVIAKNLKGVCVGSADSTAIALFLSAEVNKGPEQPATANSLRMLKSVVGVEICNMRKSGLNCAVCDISFGVGCSSVVAVQVKKSQLANLFNALENIQFELDRLASP